MTMRRFIDLVESARAIQHIDSLSEPLKAMAEERFNELANGQRHGPPEKLGGAYLTNKGIHASGLYAGLTEHVGDLTHRMAQNWSFFRGAYANCRDKVELGLRRCEEDIEGQVTRNYKFKSHPDRDAEHQQNPNFPPRFEGTLDDWVKWWKEAGNRYADAHAALTVWNEAQWHARQAAVMAGRCRFFQCERHLNALLANMGSKEEWQAYAGQVIVEDGNLVPFKGPSE